MDSDETLSRLLDAIPDRLSSKLEPHAAVIGELRKKRRTYSEIVAFLKEHLDVQVAPSTLHYFVKSRAKQARVSQQAEASWHAIQHRKFQCQKHQP